jgi:nucleolar MIF4G domain-containing protein 1
MLSDFSIADAQLLPLAAKMRMNTPARQAIFVAIMGADDSDAAIERILRLELRGPAEREIIRVLLDCCAQEERYNDFYDAVCSNLCTLRPSFKFTVQLALWDLFKLFGDEQHSSQRRVYNLAMLLANLILRNTATLTILKPLEAGGGEPGGGAESGDIALASETGSFFTKALLCAILSKARSASEVERVFERCGGSGADRSVIRDSLSIFLQKHIKAMKLVQYGDLALSDANKRLKAASNALDSIRDISLTLENSNDGKRKKARRMM